MLLVAEEGRASYPGLVQFYFYEFFIRVLGGYFHSAKKLNQQTLHKSIWHKARLACLDGTR